MFARALIGIAIGLLLVGGSATGQMEQTIFPDNVWAKGVAPLETEAELEALLEDVMSREQADVMGESRQIVVIHKGRLVAERYREGFSPDTKLVSWSMAKSITQALVGRAMHEGLIEDIDVPMPGPWEEDDPRAAITWRQWMTMTDGLDYTEVGETDLAENDVVQMMFGPGRFDMVGYVKDLPQIHEAGTHWNYSTAGFHTISRALQTQLTTLPNTLRTYPESGSTYCNDELKAYVSGLREVLAIERGLKPQRDDLNWPGDTTDFDKCSHAQWIRRILFSTLGMEAQPEFDASGTFLGGSLIYASARDFARFGYLYLRDGVWDGERLLPEGWVDFARTKTSGTNSNVYGAGWWIIPPEGEEPTHAQSAKSGPFDAFHAGGNEGQTIWVVPSKDLVIVRLGLMSNAPENWAALYEWNQTLARLFPDVE